MIIEVSIYDRSHPEGLMPTEEKCNRLKQSLFEMMYWDLLSDIDISPKFHGCKMVNGVFKLRAIDEHSIECLIDMVERMAPPWPDAQLYVEYKKEEIFVEALVPNSSLNLEDVLQHISRINPKLNTNKWKTMGKRALGDSTVYTLCIDVKDLEVLNSCDGFIPFRGSNIEFRVLKNPDVTPEET